MASSWVGDMVKGNYLLYLFYWAGSSSMIMERGAEFHLQLESPDKLGKLDIMMSLINFYYIRRL